MTVKIWASLLTDREIYNPTCPVPGCWQLSRTMRGYCETHEYEEQRELDREEANRDLSRNQDHG